MSDNVPQTDSGPAKFYQPDQGKDASSAEKVPDSLEGSWTTLENLKFGVFLDLNRSVFISKGRRKEEKIFIQLSNYVQTRSVRQCRSHFQKIMLKYHTVSKLRAYLRKIVGPSEYDVHFQDAQKFYLSQKKEITFNLAKIQGKQFQDRGVQTESPAEEKETPENHNQEQKCSIMWIIPSQNYFESFNNFMYIPFPNAFSSPNWSAFS